MSEDLETVSNGRAGCPKIIASGILASVMVFGIPSFTTYVSADEETDSTVYISEVTEGASEDVALSDSSEAVLQDETSDVELILSEEIPSEEWVKETAVSEVISDINIEDVEFDVTPVTDEKFAIDASSDAEPVDTVTDSETVSFEAVPTDEIVLPAEVSPLTGEDDLNPTVLLDAATITSDELADELTAETEDISILRDRGEGVDGFVTRCYEIALGREPDTEGLNSWVSQLMNREACGISVAFGFVYSQEFQDAGFDNSVYVEKMYNMLLGRASDDSGKAYWVNQLNNGTSREEIFAGFANSLEFYNLCNSYGIYAGYYISNIGMQRNSDINNFVYRLYNVCLGRDGDMFGQASWVQKLASGGVSGAQAAHGFFFSPEFIDQNYSAYDYVYLMYVAFFNRIGDDAGLLSWADELRNGYMSREQVFDGFANSPEFMTLCSEYGIERGDSNYGVQYDNGREHGNIAGFDHLYEMEDIIGDRYNVNIFIGDEVPTEVLDMCNMVDCCDYNYVKAALASLDDYLAFFPDGFFDKLIYNELTDFNIYLSGSGDAAGFTNQTDYGERIVCYDVQYVVDDCTTVTHEISHCIDQALLYESRFDEDIGFTESKWSRFNPLNFNYSNTYDHYSIEGYEEYFISDYSASFATEDRAQLFEYAMLNYEYDIGYLYNGPLRGKMEYYCKAIREYFDSTDWPEIMPWEYVLQ